MARADWLADFMIRLAPKIVTIPPYSASPSLPSPAPAASASSAVEPRTLLVLCPTDILKQGIPMPSSSASVSTSASSKTPASPALSDSKGRGVWVQCHKDTIASLHGKGPHLGALARFPIPDLSALNTAADETCATSGSGAGSGSIIRKGKSKIQFRAKSRKTGQSDGGGVEIPDAGRLFVPPYLQEQVQAQLYERVMQELTLLSDRAQRRQERTGEGKKGHERRSVLRYLTQAEADGLTSVEEDGSGGTVAMTETAHVNSTLGGTGSTTTGNGETASESAIRGVPRSQVVSESIIAILDIANLTFAPNGPSTPSSLVQRLRVDSSSPKAESSTLAKTNQIMPVPVFHLATLLPPMYHQALFDQITSLATHSRTSADDTTRESANLIALRGTSVRSPRSSFSDQLVPVTDDVGTMAKAAGKANGGAMPLVRALWRLKLWNGEGWTAPPASS